MLVFSTSPPMIRFWIERLTVTFELVASRLARSDWIARLLIVTLSMPRPNETFREPEGAIKMTLLVSPPMKKLLILASSCPSTRRLVERVLVDQGREIRRVAADPDVADLAGPAPPRRPEMT